MNMKRMFALALLMCLFMLPALAETVSYLECEWKDGSVVKTVKTADCTVLDSAYLSSLVRPENSNVYVLEEGWYMLQGNEEITKFIVTEGTVNLILTDGCTLTTSERIYVDEYGEGVLNIYAQSDDPDQMGRLTVNKGIVVKSGNNLSIHGGAVTAKGDDSAAIGSEAATAGTVTIYDGVISATGSSRGAGIGGGNNTNKDSSGNNGTVIIYGGTVTAKGGDWGAGIGGGAYSYGSDNAGHGGHVEIHGGTVAATGGIGAAGIGGGYYEGKGADVIITGGSVKAVAGAEGNKGPNAVAIGRGAGNTDTGTLKNAGGDNVTLYTLTITGAEQGTEIFGLYDRNSRLYAYATNDMTTQDTNKLYLYLPDGAADNIQYLSTDKGIYTVTWDSENGTAAKTHTHDEDGDVYYEEYSNAEHKKCTPCKGCPTTVGYVKEELEAHTWTYDGEGAKLTESCSANCGTAGGQAELILTTEEALVYDGADKKAFVQAKVNAAFMDAQLPEIVFEGDTVGAGEFTATLTVGGATAKLGVTIEKTNPAYTAPAPNPLTYDGSTHELITAGTVSGGDMQYSLDGKTWSADIPKGSEAAAYTVYYRIVGDANHNNVEPQPLDVTIAQSTTSLTAELMDNKSRYTYGETVNISASPKATGERAKKRMARFAAPAAGQVSLYNGKTQLTEAKTAANGSAVTFELNTVTAGLIPGSYTLTAQYTESENMAAQSAEVSFAVAYAETEKEADASGKQLENGCYTEQPTLTAPEDTTISTGNGPKAAWTDILILPTQDGTHTYTYYVKLRDGTIAEKKATFTVDTTPPEVGEPVFLIAPTTLEITAPATDAVSGVLDYRLTVRSGRDKEKLTVTDNGGGSYTVTGLIPGETYKFTLTVRDRAGHTTAVSFDVTAPLLPATGDNSALSMWLAMLTMAGAGGWMTRRKVHN